MREVWGSGAVALASLAIYANTFDSGYVYDDHRAILSNGDVLGTTPLWSLLDHDFWGTPLKDAGSHGSWRPLAVLLLRLDGADARRSHATNALLHAATSAAVVQLAGSLGVGGAGALLAGALFAALPVHCEAVAGVVGRADVAAALALILAILSYRRHCERGNRWALGACAAASASALLCKETGAAALPLCGVCHLLWPPPRGRAGLQSTWRPLSVLVLSFMALMWMRISVGGGKIPVFATADNPAAKNPCFLTRTLTFLYLPVVNFLLLLCPTTLSFDWSMDAVPLVRSIWDPRNLLTVSFYSALTWLTYVCFKALIRKSEYSTVDVNCNIKCEVPTSENKTVFEQTPKCHNACAETPKVVLMCLAMIVVPFVPATNLFFYVGFVVAERILYIPSIGFCILVSYGLSKIFISTWISRYRYIKKLCKLIVLLFLLTQTARTIRRNRDWKNEENLYRSGIAVNPPKAYGNLGSVLSSQGRLQEAEECYRSALRYRPNMADVHYNLGLLLQNQGRLEEAIASYKTAIEFRPSLAVAYLNLGVSLHLRGRHPEAEDILRQGSTLDGVGLKDPRSHRIARASCSFQLARLLLNRNRPQEAVDVIKESLRELPEEYQPQSLYNVLGQAYNRLGQDVEAERCFQAALSAKPDHVPAHLTYGRLLARNSSRLVEAEMWFRRALKIADEDSSVHSHYGQFLLQQRRFVEAADQLEIALKLSADSPRFEDVLNTATSYRMAGQPQQAEPFYRQAVLMRPKDASAVGNLGAVYHLLGRLREAEEWYHEALLLQPGDAVITDNLRRLKRLRSKNTT